MPPVKIVVRDSFLEIPDGFSDMTDYIKRGILEIKRGGSKQIKQHNAKVETVTEYFKNLSGFSIPHPMSAMSDMINIENVPYDDLLPEFRTAVQALKAQVFAEAPVKTIPSTNSDGSDWIPMTGESLADSVVHICTAFNDGKAACVEDMWTATSLRSCTQGMAEGLVAFKEALQKLAIDDEKALPVEAQDLLEAKGVGITAALPIFYRFAVGPMVEQKKGELEQEFEALFNAAEAKNRIKSSRQCDQEIAQAVTIIRQQAAEIKDFNEFAMLTGRAKAACQDKCKGPSRAEVESKLQEQLTQLEAEVRLRFELDAKAIELREQALQFEKDYAEQQTQLQKIQEEAAAEKQRLDLELESNRAALEAQQKRVAEAEAKQKEQQAAHEEEIQRLEKAGKRRMAEMKRAMSEEFDVKMNAVRAENERALREQRQTISNLRQEMQAQEARAAENLRKVKEENEANMKKMKEELETSQKKKSSSGGSRACSMILPWYYLGLPQYRVPQRTSLLNPTVGQYLAGAF
jgi:hypothetical protein